MQADWVVRNIRKFYPACKIIIVSDGDPDDRYNVLAEKYDARAIYQERLYPASNGAKMLHKRLEYFLEDPTDFLFKVDTDTGIHRRFRYLPDYPAFGTVFYMKPYELQNLHGGCSGITCETAEELYDSKIFLDPNFPITLGKKDSSGVQLIGEDSTFSKGLMLSEIYAYDFPEVRSTSIYTPNTRKTFACTHPCKFMKL